MFLIGLTGGIASGKSTVSEMFRRLGSAVIDADKVAREVVLPGKPAWKKIKQIFGEEFILDNGSVDRDKLGQVIFNDDKKRKLLNSITHPEIQKNIIWKCVWLLITGHQFVILDLPLLFETGNMLPYLTFTVVVSCSTDQQIKRLMSRNNLTREEAINRIDIQMPLTQKCHLAAAVIDNSGERDLTEKQVVDWFKRFCASRAHWKVRILIFLAFVVLWGFYKFILGFFR
ncbi:hypothetical protein LOTGIDRAFT_238247 [Lottia gigantea]|uniref:Dephospho-CoA kinase domain-containing protein n=1 Tax=Lottia gigantea TaxID=225164 RepID=V4CHG0_LOTGI|nr:hypothetical protein LOTGIDRAFT_238247 [Lottia gigantea]ESP01555.1 hypothetical protein LOTGIDRAFT_238247 [Lottia gigantea]